MAADRPVLLGSWRTRICLPCARGKCWAEPRCSDRECGAVATPQITEPTEEPQRSLTSHSGCCGAARRGDEGRSIGPHPDRFLAPAGRFQCETATTDERPFCNLVCWGGSVGKKLSKNLPRAHVLLLEWQRKHRPGVPTCPLEVFEPMWMSYWEVRVADAYNTCQEAAYREWQLTDGDGDNARRRAHWLNHLFYSFDKWRPWFEDQTTEQLFKYWIENEHYDLGAWRLLVQRVAQKETRVTPPPYPPAHRPPSSAPPPPIRSRCKTNLRPKLKHLTHSVRGRGTGRRSISGHPSRQFTCPLSDPSVIC